MKPFLYSLLLSSSLLAQMPETDIWLFKVAKKDNKWMCNTPVNLTNRAGYENQPSFSADEKSLFYVASTEPNQTDIMRYDFKSKASVAVTKSPVSEYSPVFIPSQKALSCVVVETDSSQRIWQYGADGVFQKIISEQTDSVGYYTWLSPDTLLYYKLTNPHSLHALQLSTGKDVWLCDNPCRSFRKINNEGGFIYGLKQPASVEFRMYDPMLKESRVYATYPSSGEDFIWHNEWGLLKAEGADILRYNETTHSWEALFSLGTFGIKKITRFVFDKANKQLIIVNTL